MTGCSVHEQAALNQMEDMIQGRQETIDRIVHLLADINTINQDITS